jgi:hypothetical protein
MTGAFNQRSFHAHIAPFGLPHAAAPRLRAMILKHAQIILRAALLGGAFLGYALSQFAG